MTDRTEEILVRLYRQMFEAGQRAGKSKRPEVRDAFLACAAMIGQECLALGYPKPKDATRGA